MELTEKPGRRDPAVAPLLLIKLHFKQTNEYLPIRYQECLFTDI